MAKEMERVWARTESLRRIGRAVVALEQVKQDGLYRTMPARYCTMIDTELRHLDVLAGRLRAWVITERDRVIAQQGQEEPEPV